ncbi:MAG: glutamate synthase large subunit [Acidobacteriota bacterium]
MRRPEPTNKDSTHSGHRAALYDPRWEVDGCGVGFVADLHGRRSHEIVDQGLEILVNLTHRGASGADATTGDGAGLLLQMPHELLRAAAREEGFTLPAEGEYGVAMLFLPRDEGLRRRCERVFEEAVTGRGHRVLGWRDVPVDRDALGRIAAEKEPVIRQLFVGRGPAGRALADGGSPDRDAFERDLYVTRKAAEEGAIAAGARIPEDVYVVSCSSRTLIYKGLLLAWQLPRYFPDLLDSRMASALALVHQRFSTNTFPEWDLAQPFRYLAHNGEINTLQGNANWMRAREALLASERFADGDLELLRPIVRAGASDSACFDNVLELLIQGGRSLPHAIMMMIPEAWERDPRMSEELRGFYEYHAMLMEPWDGPASIAFTDGRIIGATLDRNGLRPSRYVVTRDGLVVMASEVGVLDLPASHIVRKGRLQPGRLFLVDLEEHRILGDSEVKHAIAARRPYARWVDEQKVRLEELPSPEEAREPGREDLLRLERLFGYTVEDEKIFLGPMARTGKEPIGAMGDDSPLAALSSRPKLLYEYFKQHFAQVSNPPIDAIREELVTSLVTMVGAEGNLLEETPEQAHLLELPHPILTNRQLAKLREVEVGSFRSTTLSILWRPPEDAETPAGEALEAALGELCDHAEEKVREGKTVLILSDRLAFGEDAGASAASDWAPIPALLATGAVHHHLIRKGLRKCCGLVVESGEPRESHHFALLIGYGASAVNPWIAFDILVEMVEDGRLQEPGESDDEPRVMDYETARDNYIEAASKSLLKVLSKMGISTLQSYHGAQIFEAVGLDRRLVERYFTGTPSRVGGADLEAIAEEARRRHRSAYPRRYRADVHLDWGGEYAWRAEGEEHVWTPMAIAHLQRAVRNDDPEAYRSFSDAVSEADGRILTLRGLLRFSHDRDPVPIEEIEPEEAILARFKTGAMSLGSISAETHETLAIAMNRLGGRSNTGEGGEDERRYTPDESGDSRRSAIKQVASGRFGVTATYLANADEIQIKMAQGAKPGEGGQLPGSKVSVEIAAVRHSTPGVGLISPPPHHDIYSIEDLAQLIFDLKNANPDARINVKLVARAGVGTIAAGVAKGHADVVLISGDSGGTGASPWSSIKHAGIPWEIGLAETHQVLVDNGLRSRIVVETDGGLKNGRDVVIAALLGAEEFGFSTAPLISLGCIYLRKCHLNTCSVGIATQRPELRKKFAGEPAHVERYLRFVAREVRELMAELGFRTVNEMVGQVDALDASAALAENAAGGSAWKAAGLDLSPLLDPARAAKPTDLYCTVAQDHGLDGQLDHELIRMALPAIEEGLPITGEIPIRNANRTVGALLSHRVARHRGSEGLPPGTIRFRFHGSAGQSFGAFLSKGIRFELEGDTNDYLGKGLSGGELIVFPPLDSAFVPEENIIVGNVSLYGATSGEAYLRGMAGERFCVRNSGVRAVVEGVGDHGCEYMTGGRVVVLGAIGRNFAGGMSGGIAYVLPDPLGPEGADGGDRDAAAALINPGMVELESLDEESEVAEVRAMIAGHLERTGSTVAEAVLADWERAVPRFIKVMPVDYKEALATGTAHREY